MLQVVERRIDCHVILHAQTLAFWRPPWKLYIMLSAANSALFAAALLLHRSSSAHARKLRQQDAPLIYDVSGTEE